MFLVRLVYTSTITKGITDSDIQNILDVARKNNSLVDVTGLLLFNRNYFLQCLEGSRAQVNKIYHQILNDPRHENILLLDYSEVAEREFSDWSMGYIPEMNATMPVNLKYSTSSKFDPYNMSGHSAHKLLLNLRNVVTIV
ncbi:BLUF domain-containing protein [Vibrio coralliilyticus]|uniref:BLUF domain-containing protein n=1 Tax=Vibrio coralliilyticus TaxID=190893 RepID=UPI0015606E9A|nr:BLUF domain-containing protein [Vibrio coralliilyticus]NRF15159.1 BLUF domain-containing protein [Vibrio coralliilyticus]NRF61338.1 BLUF domain-containing protein [Vibrio coralliilyticus]